MVKSQAPSWGDMLNTIPTEEEENWDAVDSQSAAEDQFDDVVIGDVSIQTVTEGKELDHVVVGGATHSTGRSGGR